MKLRSWNNMSQLRNLETLDLRRLALEKILIGQLNKEAWVERFKFLIAEEWQERRGVKELEKKLLKTFRRSKKAYLRVSSSPKSKPSQCKKECFQEGNPPDLDLPNSEDKFLSLILMIRLGKRQKYQLQLVHFLKSKQSKRPTTLTWNQLAIEPRNE